MMNEITLSFADDVAGLAELPIYNEIKITEIFNHALTVMNDKITHGLALPYYPFDELPAQNWIDLPKSLDIYVCGTDEGRELNLDARGKDYATNILSYPSDIPSDVCQMMNNIPLGELVICHDVAVREADEQGKTVENHLTHLLVHGILHLLGFDHELGQAEQDEMEGFEIEILKGLGVGNPYQDDEY
ncbi:rRNA maturation RNase YbeY [Moraxella bovis]|uniref:Endoribonuclease YbeY n=1 Tax=Moraxella bovis TaxID=476 RepID=A0A378PSD0_MORBO|nr:rRNA maturation RNase YbeY [Moraxella bovis]STY91394.1 Probable rRNA maturation factor [Moraxella bovis]